MFGRSHRHRPHGFSYGILVPENWFWECHTRQCLDALYIHHSTGGVVHYLVEVVTFRTVFVSAIEDT